MLFTPEMDDLFPELGKRVRNNYKVLKALLPAPETSKISPKSIRKAYDLAESMKTIYVNTRHTSIYKTMLALLQMHLGKALGPQEFEHAFREFRRWSDKISTFKEREKWWRYAASLTSTVEHP